MIPDASEKQILTYAPIRPFVRKPHHFVAALISSSLLLGMVAAFGTVTDSAVEYTKRDTVIESLASVPVVSDEESDRWFFREERIRRGDSIASLLARLSVSSAELVEFLRRDKTAQTIFRQISPGKTVSAWADGSGDVQRLLFPLNGAGEAMVDVTRTSSGFAASIREMATDTRIETKSAEIRYSLFGASDDAGIPDGVAVQLADIFGGEIDFHRDLRKGDRFAVVYESIVSLGREIRSGKVLAAEFINNGKTYRATWFQSSGVEGGYYTPEGKSLRKAFLRSPLQFSRVTSGFTSARFHPVLKRWRAHKGIDYGAPTGTPVRATGSGTIEFAGLQGGYGKVVVIRHQGRFSTLYGHLSKLEKGIHKGSPIKQGQTIGYVGATGLASGPHLHYEFRSNGIHQNPLAVVLPETPPLPAAKLAEFKQASTTQLATIVRIKSETLALVN